MISASEGDAGEGKEQGTLLPPPQSKGRDRYALLTKALARSDGWGFFLEFR
jgi:hypothetical protein